MITPRVISDKGRQLLETFEGCRLDAYQDQASVWTIGYGHTEGVKAGMSITQHQADVILEHDLQRFEAAVERLAPTSNANQYSALVCLCFNIGDSNLASSRLLKKFCAGDIQGAADQFLVWRKVAGQVNAGLERRRAAERALFLEPVN